MAEPALPGGGDLGVRAGLADGAPELGGAGVAGKLYPPNFAIVIPTTGTHRAIQIVIDAQPTADGYLETGYITIGHLLVHGHVPSVGRTLDRVRNMEELVSRDGQVRRIKRGPSYRRFTYAFADGIDQATASGNGTPDWVGLATTGAPTTIASVQDTAYQLEGLMAGVEGGARPLVYLPAIAVPASLTVETLNRRADVALVVLDSDVALDEANDRVERVGAVALRAIV